jgi:lysophospholipase L1-like esterase
MAMDQKTAEMLKMYSHYQKKEKVERFRHLNHFIRKGQIVFAGSSLMEQFPIYEFLLDERLPYVIYNRGIGGYTTSEMMATLPECVYDLQPKYLFINIGTNDLNGPEYDQKTLIDNYRTILTQIKQNVPGVKIYMMAYYPVNPSDGVANEIMKSLFQYRTNQRINEANEAAEQLAAEQGCTWINANDGLYDENGCLKAEYTVEGMHMYADGYQVVLANLKPYLKELI